MILLLVASTASLFFDWRVRYNAAERCVTVGSRHGDLSLESLSAPSPIAAMGISAYEVATDFKLPIDSYLGGLVHKINTQATSSRFKSYSYYVKVLLINRWLVLVPLLAVAAWIARIELRCRKAMRRITYNQCVACGYDLRATPDRCPECGTLPTIKP